MMTSAWFEGLNLVHGASQAYLASTPGMLTQGVLAGLDTILLARDYHQIKEDHPEEKQSQKIAITSAVIALAGVALINYACKPSIDLKEVLKTAVQIPSQELDNIQVSWGAPLLQQLGYFISINRCVMNLFALFSDDSNQNGYLSIGNTVQQIWTLYSRTRMPWISFEKTFTPPGGPIWSSTGPQAYLTKLTLRSHILLPSTKLPELKSCLSSIHNYFAHFFDKASDWVRVWNPIVLDADKDEIVPNFTYRVVVHLKNTITPYVNKMSAWGVDQLYGRSTVNLSIRQMV